MTVHKTQGTTVDIALTYGAGLHTNALSRDRTQARLFLPRGLLETTTNQVALGEPATDDEQLQRVLTYLANALQHDGDQSLITEELHGPVKPIAPAAEPVTQPGHNLPLNAHDDPARQHRRTTGPANNHPHDDETFDLISDDGLMITRDQATASAPSQRGEPVTTSPNHAPGLAVLSDDELGHQITTTRQTIPHSTKPDQRKRCG